VKRRVREFTDARSSQKGKSVLYMFLLDLLLHPGGRRWVRRRAGLAGSESHMA
jgi:hypothetical protein